MFDFQPPFRPMPQPDERNMEKIKKLMGYGVGLDQSIPKDAFAFASLVILHDRNPNVITFEDLYSEICKAFQVSLGEILDHALEQAPRMRLQHPGPNGQIPGLN